MTKNADVKNGIKCTVCGNGRLDVFYTRKGQGNVIRARVCSECGVRHMTSERVVCVVPKREKVK